MPFGALVSIRYDTIRLTESIKYGYKSLELRPAALLVDASNVGAATDIDYWQISERNQVVEKERTHMLPYIYPSTLTDTSTGINVRYSRANNHYCITAPGAYLLRT